MKAYVGDTRVCRLCQTEKSIEEFRWSSRRRYRSSACTPCQLKRKSEKQRILRVETRTKLLERFGGACQRCGYHEFPEVLHFHHRDPGMKKYNISKLVTRQNRIDNHLEIELAKCILLCANCHFALEHGRWEL